MASCVAKCGVSLGAGDICCLIGASAIIAVTIQEVGGSVDSLMESLTSVEEKKKGDVMETDVSYHWCCSPLLETIAGEPTKDASFQCSNVNGNTLI